MRADKNVSNWFPTHIRKNKLEDESNYFQWGQTEEHEFLDTYFESALPSMYNVWPTPKEPDGRYKFSSIALYFGQDLSVTER